MSCSHGDRARLRSSQTYQHPQPRRRVGDIQQGRGATWEGGRRRREEEEEEEREEEVKEEEGWEGWDI